MHRLHARTTSRIDDDSVQRLKCSFPELDIALVSEESAGGFYASCAYSDLIDYGGSFEDWFGYVTGMFALLRASDRILVATPYTNKELDHRLRIEDDLAALVEDPDMARLWEASAWQEVIWVFVGRDFAPDGVPSTVPRDHVDVVESDEGFWCRNTKARGGISWNHPKWRM